MGVIPGISFVGDDPSNIGEIKVVNRCRYALGNESYLRGNRTINERVGTRFDGDGRIDERGRGVPACAEVCVRGSCRHKRPPKAPLSSSFSVELKSPPPTPSPPPPLFNTHTCTHSRTHTHTHRYTRSHIAKPFIPHHEI